MAADVKETDIQNIIRLDCSKGDARLFRNNVGLAWQGTVVQSSKVRVTLHEPRLVRYGLCVGSSDLIGWQTITITPEMVGQRVAVFCGIEVKTSKRVATTEQEAFIRAVREAGGRAGVARGTIEARDILNNWKR